MTETKHMKAFIIIIIIVTILMRHLMLFLACKFVEIRGKIGSGPKNNILQVAITKLCS